MRIGELASKAGVEVQTIRYYEREGLMTEPERSVAGYRQYRPTHVETLQFIRRCRSLDMTLAEIRSLLMFRNQPDIACGDIDELLARHLDSVHQRIQQLQQLERQLQTLQRQCGKRRTVAECGILRSLNASTNKK